MVVLLLLQEVLLFDLLSSLVTSACALSLLLVHRPSWFIQLMQQRYTSLGKYFFLQDLSPAVLGPYPDSPAEEKQRYYFILLLNMWVVILRPQLIKPIWVWTFNSYRILPKLKVAHSMCTTWNKTFTFFEKQNFLLVYCLTNISYLIKIVTLF